jgi:hypothetical protein
MRQTVAVKSLNGSYLPFTQAVAKFHLGISVRVIEAVSKTLLKISSMCAQGIKDYSAVEEHQVHGCVRDFEICIL